ncbi:hypothetical protein PENSPDRAFT_467673 [Peniophora sp. CONT]|nr:hypothetical protein PENSPDRAFT_467673 [Peniophora sp. CONT]
MSLGTTALARELPRKWNIGVASITIDSDLYTDEGTARTLMSLVDLPRAALPSQLFIGDRALGSAQRAAQIELSETCSNQAMVRAMKTDRDHIDSRARIGLFESLLTLILSPSPSIVTQFALVLSVLGWGVRMALYETLKGLVARK